MSDAGAPLGLTRANLAERTLLTLSRGSARNPDVLLVEVEGGSGRAVVKDFSPRGAFVRRFLAPWLVRREVRAYRQLGEHPCVPRCAGRLDALALVVEHRGGPRFSRRRPWTFSSRFGERLERAVAELHARGVVHLDLRHRSNLRADPGGDPVLIDFGSALCFRPGSLAGRLVLPLLARLDRRALRKWRRRFAAQDGAGAVTSPGSESDKPRGASRPM